MSHDCIEARQWSQNLLPLTVITETASQGRTLRKLIDIWQQHLLPCCYTCLCGPVFAGDETLRVTFTNTDVSLKKAVRGARMTCGGMHSDWLTCDRQCVTRRNLSRRSTPSSATGRRRPRA